MVQRVTLIAVGKVKGWTSNGVDDYLKRLRRFFPVEVIEVPEEDLNKGTREEVLDAEAKRLLKRVSSRMYVFALDRERGEPLASEKLAQRLSSLSLYGRSHFAFVLGGPLGLSPEVLKEADALISFGPITLPHALARLVLLEQLYRVAKINRGERYHY